MSEVGGIRAVHGHITRVILDLVLSAIAAMPLGGRLCPGTRATDRPSGGATDRPSGGGTSAKDLPRVFDMFYSKKTGGTGLGLSVAYHMVDERGGHVEVRSEPGEGTRFEVWLPRADVTD